MLAYNTVSLQSCYGSVLMKLLYALFYTMVINKR